MQFNCIWMHAFASPAKRRFGVSSYPLVPSQSFPLVDLFLSVAAHSSYPSGRKRFSLPVPTAVNGFFASFNFSVASLFYEGSAETLSHMPLSSPKRTSSHSRNFRRSRFRSFELYLHSSIKLSRVAGRPANCASSRMYSH